MDDVQVFMTDTGQQSDYVSFTRDGNEKRYAGERHQAWSDCKRGASIAKMLTILWPLSEDKSAQEN